MNQDQSDKSSAPKRRWGHSKRDTSLARSLAETHLRRGSSFDSFFAESADRAIERAERSTEQATEWLEQAKQARANNDPRAAETAAARAVEAARVAPPVQVPRNTAPELVALTELISRRAEQLNVIDDMPRAIEENLYLKLLLGTLTEFINEARDIRRHLVVRFINDGNISRKQAGEILGVHQSTIAQWVKEDTPGRGFRPFSDDDQPPQDEAENTID
jgi:hypothetical protein